jgi:hypothetical protein
MLRQVRTPIALILPLSALAACGTTRHFVERPTVTVDDSQKDARQAAAALFDRVPPHAVSLCEADPLSKECKQGSVGIGASGVGGLLLPLSLHVTALTV